MMRASAAGPLRRPPAGTGRKLCGERWHWAVFLAWGSGLPGRLAPSIAGTAIARHTCMPSFLSGQPAPTTGSSGVHRRVLVVDDDARSRQAVARLLAEEGYDTAAAADGEEAATLLGPWHPDLVLTDLEMPRLDGRALLQRVRATLPGTPVIVVSAGGSADSNAVTLESLGAAGYFAKPLRVDELLARIHDLIGH